MTLPTHIHDSMFARQAMVHANGGRYGQATERVSWWRGCAIAYDDPSPGPVWFTDGEARDPHCLYLPSRASHIVNWLLEPRELHPENYEAVEARSTAAIRAIKNEVTFTHDDTLLKQGFSWPYPHGGTRIHPSSWQMHQKSRTVSIIASPKDTLPGHKLRHRAIAALGDSVDAFGPSYTPIMRKLDALKPYRFSVAIENVSNGVFFTETLLDCFLTGTIPIYWGSRLALEVWGFDTVGVLFAESRVDIERTVKWVLNDPVTIYNRLLQAARGNFVKAHEYTCPEDWLFAHYPHLFGEDSNRD